MIDELGPGAADLPVRSVLPALSEAMAARGTAVVQAPPGSGKTTLVPPALVGRDGGRVVVTQPRRIAVRAAARRLAELLGEELGHRVGFAVRGERRGGAGMLVEFVTTGVLLRRLQGDPELPGVTAVVLDEVHERQLEADLLLALLVDVRAHLRDDLGLVAMSATIEALRTADVLGPGTPVLDVPVERHPLEVRWRPGRDQRLDQRGVTPGFLGHVATTVREALVETTGDVLVFLPGAGEVARVSRALTGSGVAVLPLHGRLDHAAQDEALAQRQGRRVVVATAVAESSLTVPGVRVVVDAGLSREPRTDHRRGLPGLVTRYASQAAAEQRAGRAARLGPGVAYRCWSLAEHAALAPHALPEIATSDLTAFVLELRRWGSRDGADLALLDQPPAPALHSAHETLRELGLLEGEHLSTLGDRVAALGTDPRLGRALLDATPVLGARRAGELVALLSEDIRAPGGDLVAALRQVRRENSASAARWREQARRLRVAAGRAVQAGAQGTEALTDDAAAGLVVALAHPARVARRRDRGEGYLMAAGTGAELPRGSPLLGVPWLALADVDRPAGRRDATIRSAAVIDEATALAAAAHLRRREEEVSWTGGRLRARHRELLGAIELASTPVARPQPARVARALSAALARDGLDVLRWPAAASELRQRLAFLHATLGEPWPDVSDDALLAGLENWLGPQLAPVRSQRDLERIDLTQALRALLPWPQASRLDELAPTRLTVPSGSSIAVDYGDSTQPVVAVRLQEVFGWRDTPRLADGRVPVVLHLLSPARRPAAVTSDLAGFWAGTYAQVRAELRGRYPKHSWPDDPAAAPALRGVRRPRR